MTWSIFKGGMLSTACSFLIAWSSNVAMAGNPWAGEVGEARSVQSKTEDIAERLSDDFPFSRATRPALHLDNIARQLESAVKAGGDWNHLQSLLHQTSVSGQQVQSLVASDCNARADRRLVGYFGELNQRLDRLDQELVKALHKVTQPTCVVAPRPPVVVPHSYRIETYRSGGVLNELHPEHVPHHGWNTAPEFHRQESYRGEIPVDPRSYAPRGFAPQELGPQNFGPEDLGPLPSPGLPPGAQIGPIQYRTQQPTRGSSPIARQVLSTVLTEIANRL